VWSDKRQVLHHWRTSSGEIETHIITAGQIALDPPGLTFAMEEIYAD